MYAHIKKQQQQQKLLVSEGCAHNQLLIKYSTELSNYAQKKLKKIKIKIKKLITINNL